MGVRLLQRLVDGMLHAPHFSVAGPEITRKRSLRPQNIEGFISRHVCPIDTSHELPPSRDLANEPLDLLNRYRAFTLPPCPDGRRYNF